jgi:hypothetical protein
MPSGFGTLLWILTLAALLEVPSFFTEFRHGLAVGLGAMFLVQMFRERQATMSLLATLALAMLCVRPPLAPSHAMVAFNHVLLVLGLGGILAQVVRKYISHRRAEAPNAG